MHGKRFGTWIAEPAPGNEGPEGAWCIHSARPHNAFIELVDPATGAPHTRTSSIEEAQGLAARDAQSARAST